MKRTLRVLLLAIAGLALLFVGLSALAYLLVDVDALVEEQLARLEPRLEEALGRRVEVGEVHARFFPTLGARIDGMRIEARAEGEAPLASLRELGFDLDLLGALLSFGEDVSLDAVWIDGLRVEIVRDADGALSVADLLEAPAEERPEDDGPLDPELAALLRRISIGEIRVTGASLALVDRAAPAGEVRSEVTQIDLRVRDVRLSDAVIVELGAAAFADAPNVSFAARVGPFPASLDGAPPVRDVVLKVDALDLGPALPYLPSSGLEALVVSSDLRAPSLSANERIELVGWLSADALRFAGGERTSARLDADLGLDPRTTDVELRTLLLKVGGAELEASGRLLDLAAAPRFEAFTLQARGLDLERLLAIHPPTRASLPPGARLAGPVVLDVRASGDAGAQQVKATVDLGGVDVLLPGSFVKPAGTALSLDVDGDFTPSSARLRLARLTLDELSLQARGDVRDFANPTYDFALDAAPFSFDRLVRLLPAAAEGLRAQGATAAGRGAIRGHLKGAPGSLDAELDARLEGVELSLPDTRVEGGVTLHAFAKGDPAGALRAGLRLDAADSVIRIPGTLDKAASTPLVIDVLAERRGGRIELPRFELRLAELVVQGAGALAPGGDAALELRLHPLDLERFAATVPAIPAERVRGGRLEARLVVKGDPSRKETLVVELPRFSLRLGESDLAATATVRHLDAPEIVAALRSRRLDVDALLPPSPETAAPQAPAAREDDPALKEVTLAATFDGARVRLAGRELTDVRAKLALRDGVLKVERARFGLYGGTVDASGSEAELWRGRPPFRARLVAKDVDAGRMIAAELGQPELLTGRANLDVRLDGEGFEKADLERSLTGLWDLAVRQGRLRAAPVSRSVLGDLAGLPGFDRREADAASGELRELLAGFEVEKGRMKLRRPLTLNLDGNDVRLDGAVGIWGELFLDGTYAVSPKAVAALTGGRCRSDEPALVPLAIRGTAAKPQLRPDGKAVAALLARSCLAGKVGDALERLAGDGAAGASAKEAEGKAREAALRAEREAERLKQEAARKRREAERKAREKAKAGASKLKDRLGL